MRKILIVLSEWGFWGEELIGPLETFDNAGYESHFVTPTGKRPMAILDSKDPNYVDPPLGRSVTTAEMAAKTQAIDDPANPRLDNPINLSAWFPVGHATSVIVDYPFITGRSTPDSYLTGQMLVEVLEQGRRRYGW